jgi:hypothetical protein
VNAPWSGDECRGAPQHHGHDGDHVNELGQLLGF